MVDIVVEHQWKSEDGEEVFRIVESIVEMSNGGKLPAGFELKSVDVLKDMPKAICRWDAPSASALSDLVSQVNPPTEHKISEVQKVL